MFARLQAKYLFLLVSIGFRNDRVLCLGTSKQYIRRMISIRFILFCDFVEIKVFTFTSNLFRCLRKEMRYDDI